MIGIWRFRRKFGCPTSRCSKFQYPWECLDGQKNTNSDALAGVSNTPELSLLTHSCDSTARMPKKCKPRAGRREFGPNPTPPIPKLLKQWLSIHLSKEMQFEHTLCQASSLHPPCKPATGTESNMLWGEGELLGIWLGCLVVAFSLHETRASGLFGLQCQVVAKLPSSEFQKICRDLKELPRCPWSAHVQRLQLG